MKSLINPSNKPAWIMFGILIFSIIFFIFIEHKSRLQEVSAGQEVVFYSNQSHDNLQRIYLQALNDAKKSIILIVYTISDRQIIDMLKKKALEGIQVTVICDAKANPNARNKLAKPIQLYAKEMKGIMHQKILVVDEERVWLGSANMTSESLKMHGNLVNFVDSPEMAQYIAKKSKQLIHPYPGPPFLERSYRLENQTCELWFLPDNQHAAKEISKLIQSAKKTIRVAMFTWTRMDLAKAMISAHQRGVKIEVVLDQNSAKGAGIEVTNLLKSYGIPVKASTSKGLLHYKTMIIDDEILVNGSANWTKAAFSKNDDCFLVLRDLSQTQKSFLERWWRNVMLEAS